MNEIDDQALDALMLRWQERIIAAGTRSRQTKTGEFQTAYYFKGVAETYRTALAELRDLLYPEESLKGAAAGPVYLRFPEEQVARMLTDLGLFPRILRRHDDGVFTAVFSRLQPIPQARRLELLQGADARLRIVQEGALRDTGDPYIEFGFVEPDEGT